MNASLYTVMTCMLAVYVVLLGAQKLLNRPVGDTIPGKWKKIQADPRAQIRDVYFDRVRYNRKNERPEEYLVVTVIFTDGVSVQKEFARRNEWDRVTDYAWLTASELEEILYEAISTHDQLVRRQTGADVPADHIPGFRVDEEHRTARREGWVCKSCGMRNAPKVLACQNCGVSKRWQEQQE